MALPEIRIHPAFDPAAYPSAPVRSASRYSIVPLALFGSIWLAVPLAAQHSITAPSGLELVFDRTALVRMNDTTDALRENLELDPLVAYYSSFDEPVDETAGTLALPWNAVDVLTDSLAAVLTPGNLREADRAYVNYAVIRMRNVRGDPDVSCDAIMALEVEAVSAFADGWVVARALFGGPPYAPLDELAFAREDGVLAGLIGEAGNPQLGGCLAIWREEHSAEMQSYREWRESRFAPGGA